MTSREQLPKQYMLGDVVKIQVEIEHKMNLKNIEMVFVLEGGEGQDFVLTGTPEIMYVEDPSFGNTKRSKVDVQCPIDPFLVLGTYHLRSITLTTVGGKSYLLSEEDLAMVTVRSLEVITEPKSKPRITSAYHPA